MPLNKATYEAACYFCDKKESIDFIVSEYHPPPFTFTPTGWTVVDRTHVCEDHEISIDGVVIHGEKETVDAG